MPGSACAPRAARGRAPVAVPDAGVKELRCLPLNASGPGCENTAACFVTKQAAFDWTVRPVAFCVPPATMIEDHARLADVPPQNTVLGEQHAVLKCHRKLDHI